MKTFFFILLLLSPAIGSGKVLRIGGEYKISSIQNTEQDRYRIEFHSIEPTGRFDRLVLHSNHVHMNLEKNDIIKLSAEVLRDHKTWAEVAQVLLFLPSGDTHVPVWMLSDLVPTNRLNGAKYLQMHAPTADYYVM
ncbi:MAG: hypothetical protein CMP10_13670 [Zetaproteobacteria bacterium]|nr:hypothetical protein [Pseudobdellovibrionaceae bacterium]